MADGIKANRQDPSVTPGFDHSPRFTVPAQFRLWNDILTEADAGIIGINLVAFQYGAFRDIVINHSSPFCAAGFIPISWVELGGVKAALLQEGYRSEKYLNSI